MKRITKSVTIHGVKFIETDENSMTSEFVKDRLIIHTTQNGLPLLIESGEYYCGMYGRSLFVSDKIVLPDKANQLAEYAQALDIPSFTAKRPDRAVYHSGMKNNIRRKTLLEIIAESSPKLEFRFKDTWGYVNTAFGGNPTGVGHSGPDICIQAIKLLETPMSEPTEVEQQTTQADPSEEKPERQTLNKITLMEFKAQLTLTLLKGESIRSMVEDAEIGIVSSSTSPFSAVHRCRELHAVIEEIFQEIGTELSNGDLFRLYQARGYTLEDLLEEFHDRPGDVINYFIARHHIQSLSVREKQNATELWLGLRNEVTP